MSPDQVDLASLVAGLPDVVYQLRLEPDAGFEFVSDAVTDLVGFTPQEHYEDPDLGQRILDPRDVEALMQMAQAPVGQTVEGLLRWRSRDGRSVWTQHRCVKRRRPDGSVVLIGSAREVSAQVEAADQLAAERAELRLLTDYAGDIVLRADMSRALTYVSPAVTPILGWAPEDLVGRPLTEFIHPDDVVDVAAVAREAAAGEIGRGRSRVRCADGGYRWIDSVVRQLPDDREGVTTVVAVWRDVEAAVQMEAQLRNDRALLAAVLRSELDPHVYLKALRGESGQIVDFVYEQVNDAACDYMRMTRHELEGARVLDLLPGQAGSGMLAMYADAVETGVPLALDDYSYPNEVLASERRYDIRAIRVGDGLSFAWRDVTDRYRTATELAESQQMFRLLAEHATDVVFRTDADGRFTFLSEGVVRNLGWQPGLLIGRRFADLLHPEDRLLFDDGTAIRGSESGPLRFRLATTSGDYRWVEANITSVGDEQGAVTAQVGGWHDVTSDVKILDELQRKAQTDPLTGLLNRGEILTRLNLELNHAPRSGQQIALVYCDLDQLKPVNDDLGHSVGDRLIATTAERISAAVRHEDLVARVGGDEFLVVLNGVHDLDDATAVADKILEHVAAPIVVEPGNVTLRPALSIGVALWRPGEDVDAAIARADAAMYSAKHSGGATISHDG